MIDIQDFNSLAPFILAALVEAMGGVVELDAKEVLDDIKNNKYKKIALSIQEGRLYMEVFDEN